ncbi:MAG: hypothetical protein ACOCV2_10460 [Persicimonas sp.]
MRRHSHTCRVRQRRRRAAGAIAALLVVAGLMLHCQTPEQPETPEQNEDRKTDYRSVSAEGSRAPDAGPAEADAGSERAQNRNGTRQLRPSNHTADWLERHGAVARANPDDCTTCHQEEDCASCHTEQTATPFRVHPPNFETIHASDARLNSDDCAECHKPETFCAECHARSGVDPEEPDNPPPRTEFHPPGWLDANDPNNHGVASRRNLTECATCHTERDCVTCHQGIDPHPPEFQLDCGRMLRADPRPCAQCHQDLGMLKEMCL